MESILWNVRGYPSGGHGGAKSQRCPCLLAHVEHFPVVVALVPTITSSTLHIVIAEHKDALVAGRRASGKLASDAMEQSRSANIFIQRQGVDLAHQSFPTRHCHSFAIDVDGDLLGRNLAEQMGGRYLPRRSPWSAFWIAGSTLLEPGALGRISVFGHFAILNLAFHSSTRLRQLRPKRRAASVSPITSRPEAARASGTK